MNSIQTIKSAWNDFTSRFHIPFSHRYQTQSPFPLSFPLYQDETWNYELFLVYSFSFPNTLDHMPFYTQHHRIIDGIMCTVAHFQVIYSTADQIHIQPIQRCDSNVCPIQRQTIFTRKIQRVLLTGASKVILSLENWWIFVRLLSCSADTTRT